MSNNRVWIVVIQRLDSSDTETFTYSTDEEFEDAMNGFDRDLKVDQIFVSWKPV